MSKMKKVLLMCTAYVLVAALAIGGTIAYLTDTDSDVNVMTTGNVSIKQIELERIQKSESAAGNKDNFQPYTQKQTLFPATGTDEYGNIPYAVDENGNTVFQQLPYGGAMQLWDDDGKNVMDKLVFVQNNGKTNAYVRTIIAYEGTSVGGDSTDLIHPCYNGTFWSAETVGTVEIDGVNYTLAEYIYKRDDGVGAGVLKAGETTRPSLLQLYMASWADNEDVAQFGDTYEILVASQAVQAVGFEDAKTALDAAFGDITVNNHPWIVTTEVDTIEELKAALAAGNNVKLAADVVGDGDSIVIGANNEAVVLDLNGHSITNAVTGGAAIVNYGNLTITGDGAIVNGVSDTKASHTVHNYGILTVNGGDIGTFASAGAAVRNDGVATINGGNFASRQENNDQYGKGPAAYCLVNNSGTMTINNATVNGPTHGIFAANAGELIVNGGNYTLIGNNGMGCYVAYAGSEAKVTLNGGVVYTYEPRHNRKYYVYDNGNHFDAAALATGKIVENGIKVYLNAETVTVNGTDKAAVVNAIETAEPGDTVQLTEDTIIAGYDGGKKLTIDKDIILDLNGKTLTTECGWGGIDAKGGCSIKNGTINHTGNTAAIKAFQVVAIEDVTINVTQTAGKTKGGIVVQEGAGCYVGSIKNVTISGVTNGIETYRCGDRTDLAIGSMENVTIDATDTGILLSTPVGTVTNCNIEGDAIGVNMYLYGPYSVSMKLVNSTVTGATGIYAHDEVGKTNPGSLTLTYDAATVINGGITQEFEAEVASRVAINK